ncbi:MAG TPA: dihydrofolate reductase family protein [Acidimicrobiales bacterium]|nr:dihydrofolate reductase family protein [Acidimicrobiales bacterium]
MARLRVHNFTLSVDGYAAGPNQRVQHPLGEGGMQLHEWIFQTASFREMGGEAGGDSGLNDQFFRARTENVGATIMGRNMFGPIRGPWVDETWRGWWGEDPPFGHDVFVLTHHRRSDLKMGNTTFHFVEAEPRAALELAIQAAHGRDVVLGGGAATIREFLNAGLIDEMHVVIAPVLLGAGERLFDGLPTSVPTYTCSPLRCESGVAHAKLTRLPTSEQT